MKKTFLLIFTIFLLSLTAVFADDQGMGRPTEDIKDMNPGAMHSSVPNQNQAKPEPKKPEPEPDQSKPTEPAKSKPTETANSKPNEPVQNENYGRPIGSDARDMNEGPMHIIVTNYLGKNVQPIPQEQPKEQVQETAKDPDPFKMKPLTINDGGGMQASFSEISGMETEADPIDYRTGPEDVTMRKISGLKKSPEIIQKRGAIDQENGFKASDALNGSVGQAPKARDMDQKEQVAMMEMRDR